MKGEHIGNALISESETDWDKLRSMSDAEVHAAIVTDGDITVTDENFWRSAEVVLPQHKQKELVTMRLDSDLLAWFRQKRGYQTRINAILLTYMKAHCTKT